MYAKEYSDENRCVNYYACRLYLSGVNENVKDLSLALLVARPTYTQKT